MEPARLIVESGQSWTLVDGPPVGWTSKKAKTKGLEGMGEGEG